MTKPPRQLDTSLKSRIRQLYADGCTVQMMSRRLNLDIATTRMFMVRLGLDFRPQPKVEVQRVNTLRVEPSDYRYDTPDQVVIVRNTARMVPSRPVVIFSVSSLI